MTTISNSIMIKTSRRYNLEPGSIKCTAFALFDGGYSRREVRFLLRSDYKCRRDIPSGNIRKYQYLWESMQKK